MLMAWQVSVSARCMLWEWARLIWEMRLRLVVMSLRLPPSPWGQPGKGQVRNLKTAGGVESGMVKEELVFGVGVGVGHRLGCSL